MFWTAMFWTCGYIRRCNVSSHSVFIKLSFCVGHCFRVVFALDEQIELRFRLHSPIVNADVYVRIVADGGHALEHVAIR